MYQNVYEYDLPLFKAGKCKFEFVQPEASEYENPWKESFKQLVIITSVKMYYILIIENRSLLLSLTALYPIYSISQTWANFLHLLLSIVAYMYDQDIRSYAEIIQKDMKAGI